MTPAQLILDARRRKGLSQRRLALRAGTSQSAIARIEAGAEEVTWPRLRAIMISLGEEPVLTSRPLKSRYDAADMVAQRAMSTSGRLESGLAFDRLASELTNGVRRARIGA
ncbi:MAG TPA: helix-turn-helix domain-containing protein [Thermoleophilaceae bacterium]|nr:helix-turn-helix domain-containing protein [Thermoleophilaceae bacterium]